MSLSNYLILSIASRPPGITASFDKLICVLKFYQTFMKHDTVKEKFGCTLSFAFNHKKVEKV